MSRSCRTKACGCARARAACSTLRLDSDDIVDGIADGSSVVSDPPDEGCERCQRWSSSGRFLELRGEQLPARRAENEGRLLHMRATSHGHSRLSVRARAALFLTVSSLLAACGAATSRKDAERALAQHYQAIAAGDYGGAMAGYDDRFFTKIPREKWAETLAKLGDKLGAYQSHRLGGWNVQQRIGVGSGTYVNATCLVSYSKFPAEERITLFRANADGPFKILGHNINSTGLLPQ